MSMTIFKIIFNLIPYKFFNSYYGRDVKWSSSIIFLNVASAFNKLIVY